MGNHLSLSQYNNKLSFDLDSYVRERDELAELFRSIKNDAAQHRQRKGKLQVVNGASGVAAGVAGAVGAASLLLAPATMGMSLIPTGAAAIVNTSLTAASVTSSAAAYGYNRAVDRDIAKRLHNVRHIIECIAKKDEEVNSILLQRARAALNIPQSKEEGRRQPVVTMQACQKLCQVWREWDDLAASSEEKRKKNVAFDLPMAIFQTQGILFGTKSIIQGSKRMKEKENNDEDDIELALALTATNIAAESTVLRSMENQFRYLSCISPGTGLPRRGRLTYIDGGGGCSRVMVVCYYNIYEQATEELKSDSSNCIRLPEGATKIKVHFQVKGGNSVKKVNRSAHGQPWVKSSDGKYEVDVFDFDKGDGVDAAFVAKGTMTHSWIEKAWDFGRRQHGFASVEPREWEWWENAIEECKEVAPDIEARTADRASAVDESCGMQLVLCGACFETESTCLAPVA